MSNTTQSASVLVLTLSEAARLLRIDRGRTLHQLIASGRLRSVPWGKRQRIPLEDLQRLAREGFTVAGKPSRAVSRRRAAPAPGRISDLEIEP